MKRRSTERFYDYFSDEAQKVLTLASEEAKRLAHEYVRTEHLLLAIIKEEGVASRVLQQLGIDPVNLFSDLESMIGHGEGSPAKIVLSPRAKKVLELAYNAARELGFNYVGPEHVLLGVIREGESLAAQALHKRKITFDRVAREIIAEAEKHLKEEIGPDMGPEADLPPDELSPEEFGGGSGAMFGFPGLGIGAPPRKAKPALASFGRDLTVMAREGKLDPVINRQKEIDRVMRILSRRTKNNPALLGDPGVGKTAIIEGLAERIVKGEVPDILKDKQVIALDLGGMVAGTKYRGEFEARVKKVLEEILAKKRKIILFIDELHTLVGAGGAEGAIDAGNMLKPALARGELQVIGATTLDEYRKYIEKDAALERRFQPVMINEPSVELTIDILKGIRGKYEEHHQIKIPDAALIAAASLADRYISDRFLPDKAIDVMDEAAAKVRMRLFSPAKNTKALRAAIAKENLAKDAALAAQKYEEAAKMRDKIILAEKKLKELEEAQKNDVGQKEAMVTEDDIAEIVSDWTGIPVVKLTAAETEKLTRMEDELHKRIIGQDDAVRAISQAIRRGRAGLKPPQRPIGSFIFAGPTGVGKTEVARRLSEFMFGTQEALIRMDMSEFMEKHTVSRLLGAPPGYVGYEEGGKLTEAVRRKPYSVLLFDEIEKAHPDVFNVLLQILEDGRVTDAKGREVDFKNTVIIMTSNIGQKMIMEQGPIGFMAREDREASYDKMKDTVLDAMKKDFRPEFLNRIDEIIVFHTLTEKELTEIASLIIANVQTQVKNQKMELEITETAKELIVKEGYEPKFGARPLRRAVQRLIENPLSNQIIEGDFKPGDKIRAEAKNGKIVFEKVSIKNKKK
ncbi:ATP-dependent Clp protease ATP-binding subunit ClpC [candidate division WOR-1 bacterium RIFCSPLOWO2_02_FULL_46_20]|uniref:ATP-dependent Clp protease ATP-binding subunit ClpC n=2 Tax=Saganbacteria TaxID=1703751 RepID=A0A1F4REJ6_UNCSA|nr:MAG: ATP-dependent Clp protease ATP-binding subunit ClpC [candidate division WOR-1 bacterium RIFCSPLOWO2_02_FULL_46_20]OGC09623.1 MAG: ATP-dependent Clp protease ATP-binding subunit ClpC [candidate division WOR-1 bacterium RIFCSPLOWO2_12_FULL_45_9]